MEGIVFYTVGMVITAVVGVPYRVFKLKRRMRLMLAGRAQLTSAELEEFHAEIIDDAKFWAVSIFFWPVVWGLAPFVITGDIFSWLFPKLVFDKQTKKALQGPEERRGGIDI